MERRLSGSVDLWLPIAATDRHDGQVHSLDRRAVWVMRRAHRGGGWCVEVREDAAEGALIARYWRASRYSAQLEVDTLRARLVDSTLDDVIEARVEPPPERGIVVAHGSRGRSSTHVAVSGEAPLPLCATLWLAPGNHTLHWYATWPTPDPPLLDTNVTIDLHSVTHLHHAGLRLPGNDPVIAKLPVMHRCRAREISFQDGALAPGLDPSDF